MSVLVQAVGKTGFGTYRLLDGVLEPASGQPEAIYMPGFIDLHVHGGFGIDFMGATTAEMRSLLGRFREVGYAGLLPTTVTAPAEAVSAFLSNLPEDPMILGFHLEGPFISSDFPGAQPPSFIRSATDMEGWAPILNDPRLKQVTVAPEIPGGLELIHRLSNRGVKIGLGHTNATYAQALAGFDAGASHTTHTFNAMRPLHHREAGTVGFALLENALATELIYDRHHVVREAAELLRRCKPQGQLLAVSDGTMAAGLADGTDLTMWGLECHVSQGTVRLNDGTLAGSAITLLDAFQNLADDFGVETAIRATSLNPRHHLGLTGPATTHLLLSPQFELREVITTKGPTNAML